ncbi:MAG TPA: lactate racemase domain-containing protein [Propionibacteriaceae bacterium]|nr:lactate racemase domain-containing protein [Propionibacteriaceae bacterium]
MARPGFVLEVDDRTPPLVVHQGAGFRRERFPLGTQVVYAPDPLPPVDDVAEAIDAALDQPTGSAPLRELLRPGMRLTIAFDDITAPVPQMRRPDIRSRIVQAVLTRAAAVGVDDVALICAVGTNRRNTEQELQQILGERVFRSFFADGLLTNHDAEDPEQLAVVGTDDSGDLAVSSRAAESDLLVFVHVATRPADGGAVRVVTGLGSAATIRQVRGLPGLAGNAAARVGAVVAEALPIFSVEAVLDNEVFGPPLEFLGKREWEWSLREQATWLAVRRGLSLSPGKARRRVLNAAAGGYSLVGITAGRPDAVADRSRSLLLDQQLVEVQGQADVGLIGVPQQSPYSVDSVTNPILAAWQGLAGAFGSHTGAPFVRDGGALVLYHPMPADFSALHHPSYVDFFADVLPVTTDPLQIQEKFETKFATDPWYRHLYRVGNAFHGVHPFHLWYQIAAARSHCSDIVWVGADRGSVERLGFRAASTLADALEIVSSSVGRSPTIRYLHNPPQIVPDVR